MRETFKPGNPTQQQSLLPPPLQQSTSTPAKQTAQLAKANFKHLDLLVLKPPHSKAAPLSRPQANKVTSVPPSIPTFTLANIDQIVAQAVQTTLAKAQRLRRIPDLQESPLVNNCCQEPWPHNLRLPHDMLLTWPWQHVSKTLQSKVIEAIPLARAKTLPGRCWGQARSNEVNDWLRLLWGWDTWP